MAYLNHKIGVEVQVDEGESPEAAFALAKKTVEQWNLESNPGMAVALASQVPEVPVIPVKKTNEEKKQQQINDFIEAIKTCSGKESLERFRKLVERENNTVLAEEFNKKLKTFPA
jgi:hypothetical protein